MKINSKNSRPPFDNLFEPHWFEPNQQQQNFIKQFDKNKKMLGTKGTQKQKLRL